MDIYEFVSLLTDDSATIAVFDFTTEEEIFCGTARDAQFEDFSDCEIMSIDIIPSDSRGVSVILNIETESEDE